MTSLNKKIIQVDFQLSFIQRNEEGAVEALFFIDEMGTEFVLPFDPRNNYNFGICVEINERYYQVCKGKRFDILATEKVISKATGIEIKNHKNNKEFLINVLLRKNKSINFQDKVTGDEVELIRYIDASGNNLYLNKQDFYEIFLSEEEKEYAVISFTYSDLERDYQRTIKKFPNANYTNISPRTVKKGRLLNHDEYDYSILEEIFKGQRARDEKYNGENFYEVFKEIKSNKNEIKIKPDEEIDYGFIEIEGSRQIPENESQKIDNLEKQIKNMQGMIQNLKKENSEQKKELGRLNTEFQKTREDYQRLRRIIDGEDEEFTAVIYPVS